MTCPQCTTKYILPGEPTGSINADFQGAYFAPGPAEGALSKRAIIFLTDGFGLPLKNCKIMADNLARRLDCDVWVPDYFKGRPTVPLDMYTIDKAGVKMGIWDWIKFVWYTLPNIPALIASRPSVVDQRVHSFIKLLKEKKGYEKLGAVGYCYGGSTAVRLGSTDLVQSVVICHPGPFSLDAVKAIRVPASWACAEDDLFFPHDLRLKSEAVFAARQGKDDFIEYEFKDYKGTAHGFASRPNLEIPEVKEGHEKSFEQTVDWFKKTLS